MNGVMIPVNGPSAGLCRAVARKKEAGRDFVSPGVPDARGKKNPAGT